METKAIEFSVEGLIKQYFDLHKRAKELGCLPTEYTITLPVEIYYEVKKIAQEQNITMGQAYYKWAEKTEEE